MGLAYAALGDRAKAEPHLRASAQVAPDNVRVQLLLAQYAAMQRQPDRAVIHLRRALLCSDAVADNPDTGEALLRHTASRDSPLRADDLPDLHRYPETRRRMSELGFRSLLGVPLSFAGGPEGALVISGRHGWAFAGVASRDLLPIAGMTGLCLERALALTTFRSELERLGAKQDGDSPTDDAVLQAEIQRLRAELATTSSECEALRAEMEQLRAAAQPKPARRRKRKPNPAPKPASPGPAQGEGPQNV